MENNTFDVPAYKFSILIPTFPTRTSYSDATAYLRDFITTNNYKLIPFDDVEGITIKELCDSLQNGYNIDCTGFFLLCQVRLKDEAAGVDKKGITYALYHHNSDLFGDRYKTIEEAIEEDIRKLYSTDDIVSNRAQKCFLQRYRYKSYDEVKEKIKTMK